MAHGPAGVAFKHLNTLLRVGAVGGLTDGQLLERRCLDQRDGIAAEISFTILVERHGPMVLRVCQSVLVDENDAEDAFQATFLILVEKAGSIRQRFARELAVRCRRASQSGEGRGGPEEDSRASEEPEMDPHGPWMIRFLTTSGRCSTRRFAGSPRVPRGGGPLRLGGPVPSGGDGNWAGRWGR